MILYTTKMRKDSGANGGMNTEQSRRDYSSAVAVCQRGPSCIAEAAGAGRFRHEVVDADMVHFKSRCGATSLTVGEKWNGVGWFQVFLPLKFSVNLVKSPLLGDSCTSGFDSAPASASSVTSVSSSPTGAGA